LDRLTQMKERLERIDREVEAKGKS
jgi:hypothetical protein